MDGRWRRVEQGRTMDEGKMMDCRVGDGQRENDGGGGRELSQLALIVNLTQPRDI